MDAIDRQILAALQEDGRLSLTDLAARVGLTLSPCHRRVRELERDGVIEQYRAVVSPAAVGLDFEAIVFVTIARTDPKTVGAFEEGVLAIPNIVQAERLFGDPDYMLRVLTADLTAYQELFDGPLGALPGVRKLSSTLVMKQVTGRRALPT
ncbi:Lrp/AsnC family transcriptional regulator [Leifsonia virtsii]|uniref:Lrp/AsnC family transcriptional regulator n=1 Tax=Leifsonia virtsii TaxID=3035915 RepID=A0ABT8IS61_9MICO|nr:Lrp/AsnC family transcriptional regulator [Leifsonia virtsii]MDN4595629.1 Lrp/AsnC family transcriptional regulator [Leifsonia virtsii]